MPLLGDLIKVTDALVGRALCIALTPFAATIARRPPADAVVRRVLVIRPGGIGDAVLFIPMLRELRRAWPAATIDLLAERRNVGVVSGAQLVDRILRYDRFPGDLWRAIRGRYDIVIDTEQFHCLSAIVALLTRAPRRVGFGTTVRRGLLTDVASYDRDLYEAYSFLALGRIATGRDWSWDAEQPFYPLSQAASAHARSVLAPLGDGPRVALHPGASIPERRWPIERYAAVARTLAERGAGILILGGPGDLAAAGEIAAALGDLRHVNVAGQSTLEQAAALVSQVDVYVSADTGVLHLAYAVGTPTVHLFGPGVQSKWGPPGHNFHTLASPVPCSPCTRYGYTPPCCQGMICMTRISPEQVVAAVLRQLERPRTAAR